MFVAPCRGGRPGPPGPVPSARGVARIGMMVTVVNSGARAAGLGSPGGLTPDGLGSAGSAGKGKGKEESQPKRLRHEQAPTIGCDEDKEYVYAYVPWVMSDYKNQCLRPVIAEIEDMGCVFKMKLFLARKCSRVSIRGKEARNAWKHFLDSTRKLLPEKLSEFPKMSHVQIRLWSKTTT